MGSLARKGSDVRITEVDLSTTLTQNSNIVAAVVDVSSRGQQGPVLFTSFEQYKKDRGLPNAKVSFDHYSVRDFFEEGNTLWAYRAVGSGATFGCLVMYIDQAGVTHLDPVTVTDPTNPDWDTITPANSIPLYLYHPYSGPGSYSSSLAIAVRSQNLPAPANVSVTSSSTGGHLSASTYTYRVAAFSSSGETLASVTATVVISSVLNTACANLVWDLVPGAVGYYIYGRSGSGSGRLDTVGGAVNSWTDDGLGTPDTDLLPITNPANLPPPSTAFTLDVYDLNTNTSVPEESFECTLDERVDEMGLNSETSNRVNPFSELIRVTSYVDALTTLPAVYSKGKTTFSAGASGSAPTSADINAGWDVFKDKQRYVVDVLINSGKTAVSIQKHMDLVATSRFDCVSFLDMPSTAQKAQAALDYRNIQLNLNSSMSALFCADLYKEDPINGKNLFVPPSGAMAGLLARTTRVAQPWFSMAGLNRGLVNALDVRHTYDDAESTLLYQAQINYMRKFIGKGIPLWEQSTLYSKSSALQFLNVRVLCNVMKRSMYEYLIYGLQEPNDEILQKSIEFGLRDYLKYVSGGRGIREYQVTCGPSNNPAIIANSGGLNVAVYIVPILGTRAINLGLLIGKQGLQVSEEDIAALTA